MFLFYIYIFISTVFILFIFILCSVMIFFIRERKKHLAIAITILQFWGGFYTIFLILNTGRLATTDVDFYNSFCILAKQLAIQGRFGFPNRKLDFGYFRVHFRTASAQHFEPAPVWFKLARLAGRRLRSKSSAGAIKLLSAKTSSASSVIFPKALSAELLRTLLSCFSSFEFQLLSHKLDEFTRRFPEPIAFEKADSEDVREREVDSREQAPYSSIKEAMTDGTAVLTSV